MRFFTLLLALTAFLQARAQDFDSPDLSLERLLNLNVTSVSLHPQKMHQVATSIYVITAEDIRRAGATRLQDALNLVPGAWFEDLSYSVSSGEIRESAIVGTNTILWILDGVHLMDPINSGIFFNTFDLPMSEIDRIEVIRGPGGSIYGANAATGVVSIFTKNEMGAEGLNASMDAGSRGYLAPTVRYGREVADEFFLTAWGRYKRHDGYERNPGFDGDTVWAPVAPGTSFRVPNQFREPDDDQEGMSGGLKFVYQPNDAWKWSGWVTRMAMDNGTYSRFPAAWPEAAPTDGGAGKPPDSIFLNPDRMRQTIGSGRLDWTGSGGKSFFLSAYHRHYVMDASFGGGSKFVFDISNLEFQNEYNPNRTHHLTAGSNVRRIHYRFLELPEDGPISVRHHEREDFLGGAFLQDEIRLGTEWSLTAGAKAESHTLSGLKPEISPSLRLAWYPRRQLTFWTAASRSVTTASYTQAEADFRVAQVPPEWYLKQDPRFAETPPAAGKWITVLSTPEVKPADYRTVEIGHRGSRGSGIQWDLSAFYTWGLDRVQLTPLDGSLRTIAPSPTHPGDTVVPLYYANLLDREDLGGEALLRLLPIDGLSLELSYALFHPFRSHGLPIPGGGGATFSQGLPDPPRTPTHAGRAKAFVRLPWTLDLSANLRATSSFNRGTPFNYLSQSPDEGGYVVDPPEWRLHLDLVLRKAFFRDRCSLSVWGRDLLTEPHVEGFDAYTMVAYPHLVHRTFGATLEIRL